MIRKWVILLVAIALISQPVAADATVSDVTILGGDTKTVTVNTGGSAVDSVVVNAPVEITDRTTHNSSFVFVIKGDRTDSKKEGKIFIKLKDGGEQVVKVTVVPFEKYKNSQQISQDTKKDAQRWRQFEEQWINKRVDQKQTGDGLLTVYEQRLPYRGPVDENGMPQGEWVQVPYNATTEEPQWFYESPSGAMTHMAKQANRNDDFRRNTLIVGGAIGVTPFVLVFAVLPYYRRKRDRGVWPEIGGGL